MYDLLINAEVIVDDVRTAERVFIEALGFPPQRPAWGSAEPGKGFTFLFARVHPSLKVSPTRIEAMAVAPVDADADPTTTITFLPALLEAQGRRPWKTHANELATSDIDAVADRLDRNGCPYFRMPPTDNNPYARLWLGWTEEEPGAYRSEVDGGLMLEICETGALGQGPLPWENRPDPDLPPGSLLRVLQRSWIVVDLEATMAALDVNLGWSPIGPPMEDDGAGCRRATFGFNHPRSAVLELVQPVGPGAVGESLRQWGPGSWRIRLGVNDLEAKAADLEARGTPFERADDHEAGPVLRVDTGSLGVPGLFEFAEAPEVPAV